MATAVTFKFCIFAESIREWKRIARRVFPFLKVKVGTLSTLVGVDTLHLEQERPMRVELKELKQRNSFYT